MIVLATGHSSKLTYRYLVEDLLKDRVDTRRLTYVKLDEWLGFSGNDEATCEYFIRKEILEPLSARGDYYICFHAEAKDPEAECRRKAKGSRGEEVRDVVLQKAPMWSYDIYHMPVGEGIRYR